MFAWLEKLKTIGQQLQQRPREWLESDEEGFIIKMNRWPLHPWERRILWDEVEEIYALLKDCYSCHVLCLVFYGPWRRPAAAYEDQKGWKPLLAEIEKRYAGFNQHNLREAEKYYPGNVCFPCWDRTKPIGDLELRKAEKKIVWAEDGSIFLQWKE